jgi:hypothetical protein
MELLVKKSILLLNSLVLSVSAFGGTDIIYNTMSHTAEKIVAGNIRFGAQGEVNASNVCFDQANRVYKTTVKAHTVETCSIKELPLWKCTEEGGSIVYKEVAAQNLTAPEFVTVQKCVRFDHSDSTRPVCVEYKNVQKQQPLDFTFMKYKVEILAGDYSDPKEVEVRDMKVCE